MQDPTSHNSDVGPSPTNAMNPYLLTQSVGDAIELGSYRTPWTYLEAAFIGLGMSFVAPICNATYCEVVLAMSFSTTIWGMLSGLVPIAIYSVVLAIGCSAIMAQFLSRVPPRYQIVIPVVANSLLYSVYFSMLGLGYVRGGISILGYYTSCDAFAPALIAGFGAMTHITLRPYRPTGKMH